MLLNNLLWLTLEGTRTKKKRKDVGVWCFCYTESGLRMFCVACMIFAREVARQFAVAPLFMCMICCLKWRSNIVAMAVGKQPSPSAAPLEDWPCGVIGHGFQFEVLVCNNICALKLSIAALSVMMPKGAYMMPKGTIHMSDARQKPNGKSSTAKVLRRSLAPTWKPKNLMPKAQPKTNKKNQQHNAKSPTPKRQNAKTPTSKTQR